MLALAGAPVRASAPRLAAAIGGIHARSGLAAGRKSRFYAEITRLRQIVDLASRSVPLLFLLDELLSGTNSHDRHRRRRPSSGRWWSAAPSVW